MAAQDTAVHERGARHDERRVAKNIVRGSVGNLIEWYDWYAYTAFSVYFAAAFFPSGDQTAQLLNTAAVFAVGFLMRPIGGWVLGRYADRRGRRSALSLSVTLMAAGSLIVALTPSYDTIGVAAPVLLVTARLLQGISVGGEYSTSATYMSEVATPGKRGYYSSFQYVTLIAGQLTALGLQIILQSVLSDGQMESWGWRIAFVVGAAGAVVVLWLRRGMDESESFEQGQADGDRGSLRMLLSYPRQCLVVVGLTMGGTLFFYTYTTYLQKFMVNTSGIAKPTAAWINFCALLVFVVLQPVMGRLSDRVGRRPLLIGFGVLGALVVVPSLTLLSHTDNPYYAFVLMVVPLAISSLYTSISAVVKAELFPTAIRALGVGLPYALTVAIFGGTAEYIALWFKDIGHEGWYFYYVTACVLTSLLVYIRMRETSEGSPLDDRKG
ncbi:MFS transporter [Streptomyces acidiscabies]|uniref:Putative proline/betaine transporter n=1 Tax=Streptomyces acidiscabies TaxID=42234 RepID=A0AAP6B4M1_9ACTN|nr:MFS transporter [Streptomyces acidiscabies]MBP5941332.1 MFS transporter [Streptomyces sp. LBUM 1476]MBZ3912685.1 MFS transporter [Streptomyces acidiscabies]MDX2958168.1 MFS transporter [Streptomyces acidiscabies]MDX3018535.1 MFS transporter [Streptomyces acidiscabies]MDX3791162.1 MFS transporter [Streptomyces acidiscabies]